MVNQSRKQERKGKNAEAVSEAMEGDDPEPDFSLLFDCYYHKI